MNEDYSKDRRGRDRTGVWLCGVLVCCSFIGLVALIIIVVWANQNGGSGNTSTQSCPTFTDQPNAEITNFCNANVHLGTCAPSGTGQAICTLDDYVTGGSSTTPTFGSGQCTIPESDCSGADDDDDDGASTCSCPGIEFCQRAVEVPDDSTTTDDTDTDDDDDDDTSTDIVTFRCIPEAGAGPAGFKEKKVKNAKVAAAKA